MEHFERDSDVEGVRKCISVINPTKCSFNYRFYRATLCYKPRTH